MILALMCYCCNIHSFDSVLLLLQETDADMSNDAPAGEDVNVPVTAASVPAGDVRPTLKSDSVSSPQGTCVARVTGDVIHLCASWRMCMYYVFVVQFS